MVEMSKSFLKNIVIKNLEYQDYNNYVTIFITIIASSIALLISIIIFFWKYLIENPTWFMVIIQIFIGYEIIFFILWFYCSKQKKSKKSEIENLR